MSGRQSAAVDEALREVAQGSSAYAAAKKHGLALSTIYRATRRLRLRQHSPTIARTQFEPKRKLATAA